MLKRPQPSASPAAGPSAPAKRARQALGPLFASPPRRTISSLFANYVPPPGAQHPVEALLDAAADPPKDEKARSRTILDFFAAGARPAAVSGAPAEPAVASGASGSTAFPVAQRSAHSARADGEACTPVSSELAEAAMDQEEPKEDAAAAGPLEGASLEPQLDAHSPSADLIPETESSRDATPFSPASQEPIHQLQTASSGPRKVQMFLSLGQKPLGMDPCKVCGMAYTRGVDEDEKRHARFHKSFTSPVVLQVSMDEQIVGSLLGGRIVCIHKESSPAMLKKVATICEQVNALLGAPPLLFTSLPGAKAYVFVDKSDYVRGFVLVSKVPSRLVSKLATFSCKDSTTPIKEVKRPKVEPLMGVSRVWVSQELRGRGVGLQLMNSARSNFRFGLEIPRDKVAFSHPTADGIRLAHRVAHGKDCTGSWDLVIMDEWALKNKDGGSNRSSKR